MSAELTRPTAALGDTGPTVTVVQQQLMKTGFLAPGPADGIFGPATKAAVKQFQQSVGIAPDGNVWPDTYAALTGQVADPVAVDPASIAAAGAVTGAATASETQTLPKWVMWAGLAAAGAVAYHFLVGRSEGHRQEALANYGCNCNQPKDHYAGHARRLKWRKLTRKFPRRTK